MLYVVLALGMAVFVGVKADRADRRLFMTAGVLVVLGFIVLVLAWALGLSGGRALGALYWGALVLLMGFGCLVAYAIAAVRQRARQRPYDGT